MKKILVAGASGYLGSHVVRALKENGYWVRVLVRNEKQAKPFADLVDDVVIGEATKPETITHTCEDIDLVFSSIGITRQKEGLTYEMVDYQANLNLLNLAVSAGVKQFMYIGVINGERLKHTKLVGAKEKFVDALKAAFIDHIIIRPNGFFSDMGDFLEMAKAGRAFLIGDGSNQISPISGEDLANFCVSKLDALNQTFEVAGPETFTVKQLYQLAFKLYQKSYKQLSLPPFLIKLVLKLMTIFTPIRIYGPVQFFMSAMMLKDAKQGEHFGNHRLEDHFKAQLNQD